MTLEKYVKSVSWENRNYKNAEIILDFKDIIETKLCKTYACLPYETRILKQYLKIPFEYREELFKDPVVQLFLHLKWRKVRPFVWLSIAFHILWLILFTTFILHLYLFVCPYDINFESESVTEPTTESANDDKFGLGPTQMECVYHNRAYLLAEIISLYLISAIVVAKEVLQIRNTRMKYIQWKSLGQWIQVGLIIFTALPVYSAGTSDFMVINRWQYQAASYGIFLAWALILLEIGKLHRLQGFIEMLGQGLQRFLLFLVTFLSLFVAFALAFSILLPKKHTFYKWPWNLIKILMMMAGEVNFDDMFYGDKTAAEVPFYESTKIFFAGFVIVVGIVLFNMLIGMSVSDVQTRGPVTKVSAAVARIYKLEKILFSERNKNIINWLGFNIFRKGKNESWELLWRFRISELQNNNVVTTLVILYKDIPNHLKDQFYKYIVDLKRTHQSQNNSSTDKGHDVIVIDDECMEFDI